MKTFSMLTACAVSAFVAGGALAAPITVVNHDFEDDGQADGTIGTPAGGAAGWSFTGAGTPGLFNPNGTTQGHYGAELVGAGTLGTMEGPTFAFHFPGDGFTGESTQELGTALAANTAYTLTVSIGTRNYFNGGQVPSDFRIALVTTGGTVVAEFTGDVINGNGATPSENATGTIVLTENTFVDYSAAGATGAGPAGLGENLVVVIQSLEDGRYLDFDNVRVDASAVPEPGSLALLGLGGLALLRRRRA